VEKNKRGVDKLFENQSNNKDISGNS